MRDAETAVVVHTASHWHGAGSVEGDLLGEGIADQVKVVWLVVVRKVVAR